MVSHPRYYAIANPDSKRWQAYVTDLVGFWRERGIDPEIQVLPWRDMVTQLGQWDDDFPCSKPGVVRLESPGRNDVVTRLLLEAGAACDPGEPACDWQTLPLARGQLVRPSLLYRGFSAVLRGLHESFATRPHLRPLSSPSAVAEMFDKRATAQRLQAAGLPCPPSILPGATPAETLDRLRKERWQTAYVKLNTGSSASGIAVVHALDDPPWAATTVLHKDGRLFNTRRVQQVRGLELDVVLGFLLHEGVIVQQGIPMAQLSGQNFDVRVVMIYGQPAFTVFRLSNQPMTNLHLGGRRGRAAECRAAIPVRSWLDALDDCTAAARLYPNCAAVGIDLVFERGYQRHYLLEVNAFGDFFPGLKDERGRTVHRVEIEETAAEFVGR